MRNARKRTRSTAQSRSGMALLVVLVLVMMAALAAYGFMWSMENQYRVTSTREDQTHARLAALSGIETVAALLEQSPEQRGALGELSDNPTLFENIMVEAAETGNAQNNQVSYWHAAIVSPYVSRDPNGESPSSRGVSAHTNQRGPSLSAQTLTSTTSGGDQQVGYVYGLQNESAKIHLPTLVAWDQQSPGHAYQVLMALPGATEEIVQAWLAKLGLGRPASTRSPMSDRSTPNISRGDDPQKLVLKSWLGEDLNQNYRLDPVESAMRDAGVDASTRLVGTTTDLANDSLADDEASASASGWRNYLTWHNGQRNENFSGQPRVNLNQPDLQILHRELLDRWPADWANFVVAYRQYGPAGPSSADSDGDASSLTPDFAAPASFPLRSPLELVGVSVSVPWGGNSSDKTRNRRIASPFRHEIIASADYLGKLLDDVTTEQGSSTHGRIDVNQAPVAVLMAIPGMDRELAEKIVQRQEARSSRSSGGSPRSRAGQLSEEDTAPTVAWLLEEGIIDLPRLAQMEPYLTARSDVYSCQVVGRKDHAHAEYRCTAIVDASTRPAAIREFQTWNAWGRMFE